jgi:hypothetical protein
MAAFFKKLNGTPSCGISLHGKLSGEKLGYFKLVVGGGGLFPVCLPGPVDRSNHSGIITESETNLAASMQSSATS